jgi:hypothetical protein
MLTTRPWQCNYLWLPLYLCLNCSLCTAVKAVIELLSWCCDPWWPVLYALCHFPSDCVSLCVNYFSFTPLCSVSTSEHKGLKEKSFTKMQTQSQGNLQSAFRRTGHQRTNTEARCDWLPPLQCKGNLQSATTAVITSCSHTLAYYSKELRPNPTASTSIKIK